MVACLLIDPGDREEITIDIGGWSLDALFRKYHNPPWIEELVTEIRMEWQKEFEVNFRLRVVASDDSENDEEEDDAPPVLFAVSEPTTTTAQYRKYTGPFGDYDDPTSGILGEDTPIGSVAEGPGTYGAQPSWDAVYQDTTASLQNPGMGTLTSETGWRTLNIEGPTDDFMGPEDDWVPPVLGWTAEGQMKPLVRITYVLSEEQAHFQYLA